MKRIKVDLDELCIALETSPGEDMRWYLDAESGATILVTCEYDPAEDGGPTLEEIESHPDRYLPVSPTPSHAAFADMEAFVAGLSDERLKESLELALGAPRPFRRFKSVLEHLPDQRQAWFDFRKQRMLDRARRWLADQGIEPG